MRLNNSQRFAIDWMRTNDQGDFYVGDRTRNESFLDYATPVYAVADGTVTSTEDDMDANLPGILPASDPLLAAKLTVENIDGNHIIMDIGDGVYAMYAHFVGVAVGETRCQGQEGPADRAAGQHRQFQCPAPAFPADEWSVIAGGRRHSLRAGCLRNTRASWTRH